MPPAERDAATRPAAGAPELARRVLTRTHVELRAVVAHRLVSTAEAVRLSVGDVLSFPQPVGTAVDLIAEGALVATGELVDVAGERAVRIVALADAAE